MLMRLVGASTIQENTLGQQLEQIQWKLNQIQTSKTVCSALLFFSKEIEDDQVLYTREPSLSDFNHNHPIDHNYVESQRKCLDKESIEEIVYQSKIGVLSGRIRTN